MGARWLQAKRFKMRRDRKFRPRSFSAKGMGPTPSAVTFSEPYTDKDNITRRSVTSVTLGARSAAAQNTFHGSGAWLERLFPSHNVQDHRPDVIYARKAGLHSDMLVLARLNKSDRLTGEEVFHSVKVLSSATEYCWMFFAGNDCFFIRQLSEGGGTLTRVSVSIVYGDLKRAKTAYQDGRITWKEEQLFETETMKPLLDS